MIKLSFSEKEIVGLQVCLGQPFLPEDMYNSNIRLIEKIDYAFICSPEQPIYFTDGELRTLRSWIPLNIIVGNMSVGETIRKKLIEGILRTSIPIDAYSEMFIKEQEKAIKRGKRNARSKSKDTTKLAEEG